MEAKIEALPDNIWLEVPTRCRFCLHRWPARLKKVIGERLQCPSCRLRGGEPEWDKVEMREETRKS